jgi:protein TonB
MRFTLSRLAVAAIVAVVATFAVFLLMQSLISSGKSVVAEDNFGRLVEFVDITKQDDLQTKQRKPKKPPVVPSAPPQIAAPKPDLNNASNANDAGSFVAGDIDINPQMDVDSGLSGSSNSDGEYLPIVKIAPQYPRSAAQRGIEGYVVLEFTVTALGTVTDVKVIEAEPATIFNQAAIAAAKKFKYKPKISNGQAQEVKGVRNIIRFELEKKSGR